MLALAEAYQKSVAEESSLSPEQLATRYVGKQDPRRHLEDAVEGAMGSQITQVRRRSRPVIVAETQRSRWRRCSL